MKICERKIQQRFWATVVFLFATGAYIPMGWSWAVQRVGNPAEGELNLPIRWLFTGNPIEYRINTNTNDPGLENEDELVDLAFQRWEDVSSSALSFVRGADVTTSGPVDDDINTITFVYDNSDLVLCTAGILGVNAISPIQAQTHEWAGFSFYEIDESDIVFCDLSSQGASFGTNAQAEASGCNNLYDFDAVVLHESGHFFGLDHPDQDGQSVDAVMNSTLGDCDATKYLPLGDDAEGITVLYDNGVPLLYPSFLPSRTGGYAPMEVTFDDHSAGVITNWYWTFGDGEISTVQNPIHTYGSPGNFGVTLKLNNSVETDPVTIRVENAPNIDFEGDVLKGEAPLVVHFENQSDLMNGYQWDFGDDETSTEVNPEHLYQGAGSYTVSLTGSAELDDVMLTKEAYIIVTEASSGCSCSLEQHGKSRLSIASLGILLLGIGRAFFRNRRKTYN